MGSASGFCVRCSPVRDSLEIGGPADSRAPVAETPNDGRPAVWRAADTKTTGWTLWDTYDTAYQPLTSHEAAGRRSSNGRQGAGRRVHPPGTEHPPRAILAVHEVDHLNHLVSRSSHLAELLLQLAQTEGDTCALLDRAGLEQCVHGVAPARHTTLTTTEPRWLLRSRRQRVGCIISRLRCRVARLVQFRRFFLKRLGTLRRALVNITQIAPRGFLRALSFGHSPVGHI